MRKNINIQHKRQQPQQERAENIQQKQQLPNQQQLLPNQQILKDGNDNEKPNTTCPDNEEQVVEVIPHPNSKPSAKHTELSSDCFSYSTKCHPSIMAFSPHSKEIQKWFASIFGLGGTKLKDGMEITVVDEDKLIRYILESHVGKECDRNSISELEQIELERSFLPSNIQTSLRRSFTYHCCRCFL